MVIYIDKLSNICLGYCKNKIKAELTKEKMDEMVTGLKKCIFFLGGDNIGIDRFINFILAGNFNVRKVSDVYQNDDNNLLENEIEYVGKRIKEFLESERLDFLIIHKTSIEIRNMCMTQEVENALGIPILRIYFGEGYEVPDGYDSLIHPCATDFDNQLENILQLEGV